MANLGLVYVSIKELEAQRSGSEYASLEDYYESLGPAEPGEPALAVRINKDGETRFIETADPQKEGLDAKYVAAQLSILELPESEFYFFQAFRPAAFNLQKALPSFLIQMAFVYVYQLFEAYVGEIVRLRLVAHPEQIGLNKQISLGAILSSDSKEALIGSVVAAEINALMYEPIAANLIRLRERLGLRQFTSNHDSAIQRLAWIRNCLVHNNAAASAKLVDADPSFVLGQPIKIDWDHLAAAVETLKECALAVDKAYEALAAT